MWYLTLLLCSSTTGECRPVVTYDTKYETQAQCEADIPRRPLDIILATPDATTKSVCVKDKPIAPSASGGR